MASGLLLVCCTFARVKSKRPSRVSIPFSETEGSFSLPCTGDRKPSGLKRRYRVWSAIPTSKSGYKPTLKQSCADWLRDYWKPCLREDRGALPTAQHPWV